MRRKFFFILLAIIMLGTITYFYLNQIFLPVKVKAYIENNVSTTLGRAVSVESIDFNFLDGFQFTNIYIHKKDDELTPEFIIPQLSFNVLFADFIKTKKIVVPTIRIDAPVIPVHYKEDHTFNFSDIITQLRAPREEHSYTLVFKNLQIKRAQISIQDKVHAITETISPLNINASLNLDKSVTFKISGQLPKNKSSIKTTGEFSFEEKSVQGSLSLENINLDDYFGLLPAQNKFSFANAYIRAASLTINHASAQTRIEGQLTTDEITVTIDNSSYKGQLNVNDISLSVQPDNISGRGLIQIDRFVHSINGTPRVKGDILGRLDNFSRTPDAITLASENLNVSHFVFFTENMKTIKADARSSQFKLTRNTDGISIRGDFHIQDMAADLKSTTLNASAIRMADTHINIKDTKHTFQGNIDATTVKYTNDTQTLTAGALQSKDYTITLTPENKIYKAKITTTELNLTHKDQLHFIGQPQVDIKVAQADTLNYDGNIVLNNGKITGIDALGPVSELKGTVTVTNDQLVTDQLSFSAYTTPITITGELNDFKNPKVKTTVNAKALDLQSTLNTLKTKMPQLQNIDGYALNGTAEASINFLGHLNDIPNAAYNIILKPENANIQTPHLAKPFTKFNGDISYNGKSLDIEKTTLHYDTMPIKIDAKWVFSEKPVLSADVSSEDVNIDATVEFHKDNIEITKLSGDFHDSSFSATGTMSKNFENPEASINSSIKLNTEDLYKIPFITESLHEVELSGKTHIQTTVNGPLKEWKNMTITASLQSDEIILNTFPFNFVDLSYTQDKTNKSRAELNASLYKGSLIALSSFDLTDPALPCKFSGKLTDLDLADLRKKRQFTRQQHLSGALTFYFDGFGPLKERSKTQGKGYFAITNGYLGQLIPYYKEAHFTDAQANFYLAKGRVITSDGELFSNVINIGLNGWIDFEKNYSFRASPKINDVILSKSKNIKIDPSMLLRETINLSCEGTLPNKPKCKPHASPKKILNNTTDILREGIGTIFEGLL